MSTKTSGKTRKEPIRLIVRRSLYRFKLIGVRFREVLTGRPYGPLMKSRLEAEQFINSLVDQRKINADHGDMMIALAGLLFDDLVQGGFVEAVDLGIKPLVSEGSAFMKGVLFETKFGTRPSDVYINNAAALEKIGFFVANGLVTKEQALALQVRTRGLFLEQVYPAQARLSHTVAFIRYQDDRNLGLFLYTDPERIPTSTAKSRKDAREQVAGFLNQNQITEWNAIGLYDMIDEVFDAIEEEQAAEQGPSSTGAILFIGFVG